MQLLSEPEAIGRIFETVELADTGSAPFVLVLGSGFSHGLVPTAREVVGESLPLWMHCQKSKECFETAKDKAPTEKAAIAKAFWKRMAEGMPKPSALPLDSLTGMPTHYADAYKAAFDPRFAGAVGEPAQARKFQRALMRLEDSRLNAAHFLLASMLGVQPGKSRESKLFKTNAAFSRLILTTNFDPFLQTALQLVSRLYFMSDTPDLGMGDEIYDDATDAVHLVYVHGSIHRRSQAATDQQIQALKEKNARTLAPVLKRHGVIVLGYSGWDDAIVEALAACESFDHRLYWCGLEPDPTAPGAFGPRVADILNKPSAFYVPITGAGRFMARLCNHLVEGLPRLLSNPIGQLRDLLALVDLADLETPGPGESSTAEIVDGAADAQGYRQARQITTRVAEESAELQVFVESRRQAIVRLRQAEQLFVPFETASPVGEDRSQTDDGHPIANARTETEARAQEILISARLAGRLENFEEALRLCEQALALPQLGASVQAEIRLYRGTANYGAGNAEAAVADWTEVAESPGAPIKAVAQAICNRGITKSEKGQTEKALADFTRIIDQLPNAPVEQVARALINRGVAWTRNGDTEKALADFTRIIDQLSDAPVEQIAQALNNRGVAWGEHGEIENELADYTQVIDRLPGAPVALVVQALNNRGVAWGKKGDEERAIADFSRVLDQIPKAPNEQVALALLNCGVAFARRGEWEKGLTHLNKAIDQFPKADVGNVAQALNNRGIVWGKNGAIGNALADFTQVVEHLPGAPVEQIAQALLYRGTTLGENGHTEEALADFTRIIDQLEGVPVELTAYALSNRGATWGKIGNTEMALADFTRAIEHLPGVPVEQLAYALYNRGVTWTQRGDTEKALTDFIRIIDQLPGAPAEMVKSATASARALRG